MTYVKIMTREEYFEILERKLKKYKRIGEQLEEKHKFLHNRLTMLIRLGEEIDRYNEERSTQ